MADILDFINNYLELIYTSETDVNVFFIFLAVYAVIAALRIALSIAYRMQYSLVCVSAKPITARTGVKDTRSAFLNRVVKDYMLLGEKGVSLYSSRGITDKHINKLNFIGFNYTALEGFIHAFERSELLIGLALALMFESYRLPYVVAAMLVFVVLRLISIFFDYEVLRERLAQVTAEYVDREIGQFFTGDISSMFAKFRNELKYTLQGQTEGLSAAIGKLGDNISGVLQLSIQEISKRVDISEERLVTASKDINGSLGNWRNLIEQSSNAQAGINTAGQAFELSAENFIKASAEMRGVFDGLMEGVHGSLTAMNGHMAGLETSAQALKDIGGPITEVVEALHSQFDYIEKNQVLLEASMQKYELSMQELTAKIGEGMGSIIDYHMQNSYNSMNARLEENIKQIVGNNNALIARLQQVFEEIRQQSLSETQAIIRIKEQMDIHFDNLSGRMN